MFDLIKDIFHVHGYISGGLSDCKGLLYSNKESEKKKTFWLVLPEADIGSLLKKQPELFNACKTVCRDEALDKNISMLVLWNTGGNLPIGELKKKIMAVEEDPFFFKKHVLYYSDAEANNLQIEIKGQSISDFLNIQVISSKIFEEYRNDPMNQRNWQPLLYRIVMKIPFIKITVGSSDNLTSLFESNQTQLLNKDLKDFDDRFFKILNEYVPGEDETEPADWLEMLGPALGGEPDGH